MRSIGDLYAARLKRRLLVGCLSMLIGVPCVGTGLLVLWTVVFPALEKMDGSSTSTALIAGGLGVLALLLGLPVLAAAGIILRRSRSLDAIFKPLGMNGEMYLLYGRHYSGTLHGRKVDIYIYRGPTVDLRLSTSVQTNLQIFRRDSIPAASASLFHQPALALEDPALGALAVHALDEAWARDLLAAPQTSQAVQQLMQVGADWAIFRSVELRAGEAILHLFRSRQWLSGPLLDESAVQTWLREMQTFTQAAESLPAPRPAPIPGGTNRQARQGMNRFFNWAVIAILVGIPLCAIVTLIIVYSFAIHS